MFPKSSKRPSPLRHLWRFQQRRNWADPSPAMAGMPSHHILCAGPYTVPFARLAAESAIASCPSELRSRLALYIHVDAVAEPLRTKVIEWLGEIPGVRVTYGLFGIRPGDRIPGKWHQTMVNDVVNLCVHEEHIAFIDADLFIDGPAWWDAVSQQLEAGIYSLSVGMRDTRTLTCSGQVFSGIKTNLFTLNTAVHRQYNPQRFTKDFAAQDRLVRELPGAELDIGRGIDSMVLGSLAAQARGYRVVDLDNCIPHCHVGGFSHIKPEKFTGRGGASQEQTDIWLCRVRLINRVIDYMRARDWLGYLDPEHLNIVAETSALVDGRADLRERLPQLPLTSHETAFENVLAALAR